MASRLLLARRALRPARLPAWLILLTYVVLTLICGIVLPRVEQQYFAGFSHEASASAALAVLSTIASGMMALAGVVFALGFVVVQFSAAAYSPRLIAAVRREVQLVHGLGLIVATFGYAIATMAWTDRGGSGRVPLLSLLVVIVLLGLSLLAFSRVVLRLEALQVGNVLRFIGHQGREVIDALFPPLDPQAATAPGGFATALDQARQRPVLQELHHGGEPVSVTGFDKARLVELAESVDAVIAVECAVGDTLVENTVILRVHGGRRRLSESLLLETVGLAAQRTFDQDPKYALRLLVDVAIKALSPAINDPTTAVQAIDQIEDLLRRLGRRTLDAGLASDRHGVLRLVFPTPSWADYLTLAFDEIRQYGSGSLQVMRRLRSALLDLADSVIGADRQETVRRYLHHLDLAVEHSHFDAEDQAMALQGDRQGLGLSRSRG